MSPTTIVLLIVLGIIAAAVIIPWLVNRIRLIANPGFYQQKVIMITGASRGIGRELALSFAAHGANLVLAARSVDELHAVAAECREKHPDTDILIIPTDVTEKAQLQNLVDSALKHFGQIDILINNAGIRQGGQFVESTMKELEVNLVAPLNLTQIALPGMFERHAGTIVNIASAAGRLAEPHFVMYGVSKHGMIGFGDGLRRELYGTRVRVITVKLDFINTDMVTEIGPSYRRMGMPMLSTKRVARRVLSGIALGKNYINVGWLSSFAAQIGVIAPWVIDIYFRLFMPKEFAEAAKRQFSE
ncbi:MAG: SDR family NAD(P)-dependent oxidoreductase [Anaerolineae bacterium]|nr:SDR family NAD(P)-dependent oxidoreductase [Anaerolineae bacterium]